MRLILVYMVVIVCGQFSIVKCESKPFDDLQHIEVINKCCPINYIYNQEVKRCAIGELNLKAYETIIANPIVVSDVEFQCPNDRVLVEYFVSADKIVFESGFFTITTYQRRLESKNLCLDTVWSDNTNYEHDQQFLIRTCDTMDICKKVPCIRRCCADGEMYVKGNTSTYCQRDYSDIQFHSFESLEISGNFTKPSAFGMLRGLNCPKFRLDPDSYSDESHIISSSDGSLHVSNTRKTYNNNQYCIEKIGNLSHSNQKLYTFLCFDSKVVVNDKIRFKMYPIGLLISCCFYALTLMVYVSISKLRNLPGKILICLVISLFLAYLGIALGQLMPTSNDDFCFASGFFVYFCLIAAFSWMNVTCFDIWQTFGTAKKNRGLKEKQIKRFICYSLYGWGLPILLTVVTVTLTKSEVLSDNIRPQFGHGRCWFTYDTLGYASLIFFSGPVGLLFLINFFLFVLTLRYCNKVKREIFRMQSSNCEKPVLKSRFFMDKARFAMNSKLCIVMGITWLLEILSILFYDHKKTFFWTVSDSFNVLLGVFVFFIFVFKKRILYAVLEKFGFKQKGSNRRATTQSTYATQSISMPKLNSIDGNSALLKGKSSRKCDTSVEL